MAEWQLFEPDTIPQVSTYDFHKDRGRAAHLEQPNHHDRLMEAVAFVMDAYKKLGRQATITDLGCGDGGLLSLVQWDNVLAWGYDFTPANVAGARERGVQVYPADVFGEDRDQIVFGNITVMTEVLEHLADPHGVLRWVVQHSRFLVASSPYDEHPGSYDECHAWAWDVQGYAALIQSTGWSIIAHTKLDYKFQVVLAERRTV